MNLTDFMQREGLTQSSLATALNISQPTVGRIMDRNRASVAVALRIEAFTKGDVPADTLSAEVAAARRSAAA